MKITYQLTPRDFREALRTTRQMKIFRLIIVLVTCLTLFLLGFAWANNNLREVWLNTTPFIGVVVVWIILATVGPIYSANKQFKSMSSAQTPINFEFTNDNVRMETRNSTAQTTWSAFAKWREEKSVFLLYVSAYVFHLIPKRAFAPGEEDQFRQLLSSKVKKR